MSNPFSATPSRSGTGLIHLALLPPNTPRLKAASYQYPLKLITPAPSRTAGDHAYLVHTVYLLSYGGGLVAGDTIDLNVIVESSTRLVLLTQGSTKIFKSPGRGTISRQCMTVDVAPGAALCYLPDPVQPFAHSCFEQQQIYRVVRASREDANGSLCVLDWVSSGRPANGEHWSFIRYGSRNEIQLIDQDGSRRLLLRDSIVLDKGQQRDPILERMDDLAVIGTLILCGPMFRRLGRFFMDEFSALPRIGGRKWDGSGEQDDEGLEPLLISRRQRQTFESVSGLLWSAASVRGCVVVKFGCREVESGRRWLNRMLAEECSIVSQFGERAMLCLR